MHDSSQSKINVRDPLHPRDDCRDDPLSVENAKSSGRERTKSSMFVCRDDILSMLERNQKEDHSHSTDTQDHWYQWNVFVDEKQINHVISTAEKETSVLRHSDVMFTVLSLLNALSKGENETIFHVDPFEFGFHCRSMFEKISLNVVEGVFWMRRSREFRPMWMH